MKRVLILGATSAVAQEVARIYARGGAALFLVGRCREKLLPLEQELGARVVGVAEYDFCATELTPNIIAQAWEKTGGFDVAVIAHGLLGDQLKSESDFLEARRIISVNYDSVVAQVIPLAQLFESQGSGHLVVISSVAGERGRPRNYTYGSAKKALTIYMQGVRSRLYPRVRVTTIKLGPVDSPMTISHEKNFSFISTERAARGIVSAIEHNKKEPYVPAFWGPVMAVVTRLPEAIFQRLKFLSSR
jgi:decaprenylphospho-beta-D-erythro-pentofuranosid-2-ulose 2-reductase